MSITHHYLAAILKELRAIRHNQPAEQAKRDQRRAATWCRLKDVTPPRRRKKARP